MTVAGSAEFRRPVPAFPIERYDVVHPLVPAELDGLTVLHVTDTHVTRPPGSRPYWPRLLEAIGGLTRAPDLVALTGDYMTHPGHEHHAVRAIEELRDAWEGAAGGPPRLGAVGVFGNHDSVALVELARRVPGIRWLDQGVVELPGAGSDGRGLKVLGVSYPEDMLGAVLSSGVTPREEFVLTLVHHPTELLAAAEFGLPIVLAGHTHGGQIRVSAGLAPHTSSDLPSHMPSGLLRLRGTVACVSRGLGDAWIEVRVNCPPQAPLYTLRRGELPEANGRDRWTVHRVIAW